MPVVHASTEIEAWLNDSAADYSLLSDHDYEHLVSSWKATFLARVQGRTPTKRGARALDALLSDLPADVLLFNGCPLPELQNQGGTGFPVAYRAIQLRRIDEQLANRKELILVGSTFASSCVFSHEAGALVHVEYFRA